WGSRIAVPSSEIVLNVSIKDFSIEGKYIIGQSIYFVNLPIPAIKSILSRSSITQIVIIGLTLFGQRQQTSSLILFPNHN
ncbi:hypothetical protein F5878DRAFT_549825, partial [Lentinula raphanica]